MGMFDNVAPSTTPAPTAPGPTTTVTPAKPLAAKKVTEERVTITPKPVTKITPAPVLVIKKDRLISQEEILNWFKNPDTFTSKLMCMVLGEDGTGKSGAVLHYIAEKLRADPTAKAVVLDLDQGCGPLMKYYSDIADRLIIKDPIVYSTIEEDNKVSVDTTRLMSVIKQVALTVHKNCKAENIKYFVLDGLSRLLETAEDQMRVDLNKTITDGMQTMYWKSRKKHFFEVLNLLKAIPIDTFFIGHTNFILSEKTAAVQTQTNAMMFQRIICSKEVSETGEVKLIGEVTKCKTNALKEGQKNTFMHLKDGKIAFSTAKLFEEL